MVETRLTVNEDSTPTNRNILRFILINLALFLSVLAAGMIYVAIQSQSEEGFIEVASGEVASGSGV
tara:strand:- start:2100 stop:2297 length:198 start_codon:yes stop_codon:yes gene_type:complete